MEAPPVKPEPAMMPEGPSAPSFGQSPSYVALLKGFSMAPPSADDSLSRELDATLIQQFWVWKATALFADEVGLSREVHSIPSDQDRTEALQKRLLAASTSSGGVRFIQLKAGATKEARKADPMDERQTKQLISGALADSLYQLKDDLGAAVSGLSTDASILAKSLLHISKMQHCGVVSQNEYLRHVVVLIRNRLALTTVGTSAWTSLCKRCRTFAAEKWQSKVSRLQELRRDVRQGSREVFSCTALDISGKSARMISANQNRIANVLVKLSIQNASMPGSTDETLDSAFAYLADKLDNRAEYDSIVEDLFMLE